MRGAALLLVGILLLAGCMQDPAGPSTPRAPGTSPTPEATATNATTIPRLDVDGRPTWEDKPCDLAQSDVAPTPLPDLIALQGRNGITRYSLEGDGSVATIATGGQGPRLVAVVNRTVATADLDEAGWRLVARTEDLVPRRSLPVPQVTAMAAEGGLLYVATRSNLTVYDEHLEVLGRIDIGAPSKGRLDAVHAVRVADGHAHLLAVARGIPGFMVLRVDVRDPAAMQVTLTFDVAAQTTPVTQWLDTERGGAGTWYVEQNALGPGASGAWTSNLALRPLDLANGTAGHAIAYRAQTFPINQTDRTPREDFGHAIMDTTFRLPAWAVTANATHLALSRIAVDGSTLVRTCVTPLQSGTNLLQHGGLLLVHGRDVVQAWDVAGDLALRQEFRLPSYPAGLAVLPEADASLDAPHAPATPAVP